MLRVMKPRLSKEDELIAYLEKSIGIQEKQLVRFMNDLRKAEHVGDKDALVQARNTLAFYTRKLSMTLLNESVSPSFVANYLMNEGGIRFLLENFSATNKNDVADLLAIIEKISAQTLTAEKIQQVLQEMCIPDHDFISPWGQFPVCISAAFFDKLTGGSEEGIQCCMHALLVDYHQQRFHFKIANDQSKFILSPAEYQTLLMSATAADLAILGQRKTFTDDKSIFFDMLIQEVDRGNINTWIEVLGPFAFAELIKAANPQREKSSWPQFFVGKSLPVIPHYKLDLKTSPLVRNPFLDASEKRDAYELLNNFLRFAVDPLLFYQTMPEAFVAFVLKVTPYSEDILCDYDNRQYISVLQSVKQFIEHQKLIFSFTESHAKKIAELLCRLVAAQAKHPLDFSVKIEREEKKETPAVKRA